MELGVSGGAWAVGALVVGATLIPVGASAQGTSAPVTSPSRVDLSWVRLAGAESCPPADVMRASVAGLLDRDPFSDGEPYLRVEGVASRPGAGWTAVLFFRDGSGSPLGSRDITSGGADCESLAKAVVFATALTIDPRVGLDGDAASVRLAEPTAAPPPNPEETPEAPASTRAPSAPDAPERGALPRPSVVAGAILSVGSLPDAPAIGGALGARGPVYLSWASWGIGAFFFGLRETEDIGVSLAGGWLEVCAAGAPLPFLEVRACPRFLGGSYHVAPNPSEFESSSQGRFSWLAVGLGLEAAVRLVGPLAVAVEVTPLVTLTARTFTAGGRAEPLFAEERVGLMSQLALAYGF